MTLWRIKKGFLLMGFMGQLVLGQVFLGLVASSANAYASPKVTLGDVEFIVPSAKLPSEIKVNTSNNNLDVIKHNGEIFLAWRTSKNHFASDETVMYVVRKKEGDDQWVYETEIHTGKDLREPRFLVLDKELYLYFAELGTSATAFEPGRTLMKKRNVNGEWEALEELFTDGFIPWRINQWQGKPLMIGYRGGENIYQANALPLNLYILSTEDGRNWNPIFSESGVVLNSGVSETDFVFDDEGIIAVGRNEAGDKDGWGSKICRAYFSDLSDWHCNVDRRKYDSPLMLKNKTGTYLVARRQVAFDGNFDLEWRILPSLLENLANAALYWWTPKRCSVWSVDAKALTVTWLKDLPSAGDTCFPSALAQEDGSFDIYNYTSDYERFADSAWLRGQLNDTFIYKINLQLSE